MSNHKWLTNLGVNVFSGIIDPKSLVGGREAELREDKMGDKSFGVSLDHSPSVLVLDTISAIIIQCISHHRLFRPDNSV